MAIMSPGSRITLFHQIGDLAPGGSVSTNCFMNAVLFALVLGIIVGQSNQLASQCQVTLVKFSDDLTKSTLKNTIGDKEHGVDGIRWLAAPAPSGTS